MEQSSNHTVRDTANDSLPSIGFKLVGLDATTTGTNAADDCVADFTGATRIESSPSGAVAPFTIDSTQQTGTIIRANPGSEGRWRVRFIVTCEQTTLVLFGIAWQADAAARSTNPDIANPTTFAVGRHDSSSTTYSAGHEISMDVEINTAEANAGASSNLGTIRCLLSDGGNAGPPPESFVRTQCAIIVSYLGDLH